PLRLFVADEPVTVQVEALEVFLAAEELAQGDVAIAVAIHLEKPNELRRRPIELQERHPPWRDDAVAAEAIEARLIQPQGDPIGLGDVLARDRSLLLAAEAGQQLGGRPDFAQTQLAITVAIEQLEQAIAFAGDQQGDRAGERPRLPFLHLIEI